MHETVLLVKLKLPPSTSHLRAGEHKKVSAALRESKQVVLSVKRLVIANPVIRSISIYTSGSLSWGCKFCLVTRLHLFMHDHEDVFQLFSWGSRTTEPLLSGSFSVPCSLNSHTAFYQSLFYFFPRCCQTCPPPRSLPHWIMPWSFINSFISISCLSTCVIAEIAATMLTLLNKLTPWILLWLNLRWSEVGGNNTRACE